ncbi:P-loop containing nucleoside triphosphate hydrolase protein [Leucosporidium creatinivorum]|uniref:p-loop containing nucleoside triphosphate hydrolase protein n=1 Tax=Leucosporidium creatinivorum TaxID=106004 RepID=A0A1Y2EQG7_9BASI|nr:P-loop containing nucleoside triphosphate hydrolase protein [Leucosporidium creatinivorum]
MDADARLQRRLSQISHILLVLSGKGGVGKSSISVQLALSLLSANPTARIGLLDVDLTGPSLPRMLGLEGRDVHQSDDGWVPVYLDARGKEGKGGVLKCMSIGFLLANSRESVVWRGPKKNAMIRQFLGEVRWGELDYLIIDTPPGTSDEHISLLETLRPLLIPRGPSIKLPTLSSLLVSTPQALALLDVSKELTFVRRTQLPLLGLIENMSGYVCPHCSDIVGIFGQGGGEDFCRREEERKDSKVEGEGGGCRFLGRVPIDRELVALLDDVADVKVVSPEEAARLEVAQNQLREATLVSATAEGSEGLVAAQEEGEKEAPRTLVARYAAIPSSPIVAKIAQEVVRLIEEQAEQEKVAREGVVAP